MTQPKIDIVALGQDLDALELELRESAGEADKIHLFRMIRWGQILFWLGYCTSGLMVQPFSILCISLANFSRWGMISHHILHRGYDRIASMPPTYTSKFYAKGWRRYWHWFDWIHPQAWNYEHNILHHYKLGEDQDPDQPEQNLHSLRNSKMPLFLRYCWIFMLAMVWKPLYYAPNTHLEWFRSKQKKAKEPILESSLLSPFVWLPWHTPGQYLWFTSWLPYLLRTFVFLPLPFLYFGPRVFWIACINIALSELVTNIHSFVAIVPNHAGEDVYRFRSSTKDRYSFYLRQIVGSVNYRCGGNGNDFLHGWLNYQIEHHLWPDMTMLQYQKAQPRVKAICAQHSVPYVQESVFIRLFKLLRIMVGSASMNVWTETKEE